jgi:hypothetical protein
LFPQKRSIQAKGGIGSSQTQSSKYGLGSSRTQGSKYGLDNSKAAKEHRQNRAGRIIGADNVRLDSTASLAEPEPKHNVGRSRHAKHTQTGFASRQPAPNAPPLLRRSVAMACRSELQTRKVIKKRAAKFSPRFFQFYFPF